MADASSTPDVGPSEAPPSLPYGWIAQWDNTERKYYFVQISNGLSQWEVPTEPAPGVGTTPISSTSPSQFQRPEGEPSAGGDGATGDRGLTSMAIHALAGKPSSGHSSSPFGGVAQAFLSGSSSHGGSSTSHNTGGGMAEQLIGSLLGGNSTKPSNQAGLGGFGAGSSAYGGTNSSSSHQSTGPGGLGGLLSGVLGGSHGSNQHQNNYGYSQGGGSHGSYTGTAPATSYKPPSHSGTPQSNSYNAPGHQQPQGYQSGTLSGSQNLQGHSPQPNYNPGQFQQPQHTTGGPSQSSQGGNYPNPHYVPQAQPGPANASQLQPAHDPSRPFYVGGDPYEYHESSYQQNYPQYYGNQYQSQSQPHFPPPPYSGQPGQGSYPPQQPPYGGNYNGQHPPRR